jgi:S-DNA-T family DNA segregation ATPase FtsK/SpoIIIE
MNWKADQSQAGTMLDKSIKSSNLFGKLGDWLGNIFIFESIGIASFIIAFLFLVFGTVILKKKMFKPWKTVGHSCFSFAGFLFCLERLQRTGCFKRSLRISDHGFSEYDYWFLWSLAGFNCKYCFVFYFRIQSSSKFYQAKLNDINENTIGKVKSMMPSSDENFEADEELIEEIETAEQEEEQPKIKVTEVAEKPAPKMTEPEPVKERFSGSSGIQQLDPL